MAFSMISQPTAALQLRNGPIRRRASGLVVRVSAQAIINPDIKKDEAKVVDMISSADITGKVYSAAITF